MEDKEGHNYNSLGSEEEKTRFLREMFSEEQQQNRIQIGRASCRERV